MKKIIFFILFFLSGTSWASDIYWVSTTGSASSWSACEHDTVPSGDSNYCTISQANSNSAGGDTVYFRGGTYATASTSITFNASHKGSSGSWIIYQNYNDEVPILDPTSGDCVSIRQDDAQNYTYEQLPSYIEINGFKCDEAPMIGMRIANAHHIRILNNWVYRPQASGVSTACGIDHLLVQGNIIEDSARNWSPCSSNISIWNGGCLFPSGGSIICDRPLNDEAEGYHIIIRNNIIHGSNNDGTWCGGGYENGTDGNGIIFDNNDIDLPLSLVENNLIYHNGARGIQILNTSNVHVINNTLWENIQSPVPPKTNGSGEIQVAEYSYDLEPDNIIFKNNLIYGAGWGCPWQSWGDVTITSDYNMFFNYGDSDYWYSDDSDYCAWSLGSHDVYGSQYDPLFVATPTCTGTPPYECDWEADDFTLQSGSPAKNAGMDASVYDVDDDFAGTSRPQGSAYDMGAYEYEEITSFFTGATPSGGSYQ